MWGCFSEVGYHTLVSLQITANAWACQNVLDNSILPILLEQFRDGRFLLQHVCAPVIKEKSIKTWLSESFVKTWKAFTESLREPDKNPLDLISGDCEPSCLFQL